MATTALTEISQTPGTRTILSEKMSAFFRAEPNRFDRRPQREAEALEIMQKMPDRLLPLFEPVKDLFQDDKPFDDQPLENKDVKDGRMIYRLTDQINNGAINVAETGTGYVVTFKKRSN